MGEIYLVRHGQASFGADDYDQLSPLGAEQARILGRWHARLGLQIDGIALGGLKRHRPPRVAELNWSLVNGGVTKLFYQPGRLSLSTLNNYSPFEQAGDAALITYR